MAIEVVEGQGLQAREAMFSMILFSEHFAGAGVDVEEELEHARLWRTSIAHDWRYMDAWALLLPEEWRPHSWNFMEPQNHWGGLVFGKWSKP